MSEQSKIWQELGGLWSDKYKNMNSVRGQQLVNYFNDKGVKSFLEIGCNSGRNLAFLSKNMPHAELFGLEISAKAASDARTYLPTATIYDGDIHTAIIQNKCDVVYTGGVLMHIEPSLISGVIKKCIDLSNKYVVHMEPIGKDVITHGPLELNPMKVRKALRCLHDIERIYTELGYNIINKANYCGSKEAFLVLEK